MNLVHNLDSPFSPFLEPYRSQLPRVFQEQYLLPVDAPYQAVLGGQMHRIWHRPAAVRPALWLLAQNDMLFPEKGERIPTSLVITARRDRDGRPYHIWRRTFYFKDRVRQFASIMAYDPRLGGLVEWQGRHRLLKTVFDIRFSPPDRIEFVPKASFLYLRGRQLALPAGFWVRGRIVEYADRNRDDTSHVELHLEHAVMGQVFGYEGTFRHRRRHEQGDSDAWHGTDLRPG